MNFFAEVKKCIEENVQQAIQQAIADGALPQADPYSFTVEVPKDASFGDYATNAAMMGAKVFRMPPQKIAQIILEHLAKHEWLSDVTVAGAFINFRISPAYAKAVLSGILSEGSDYGRSNYGQGQRVLVEFVSANPTGPMHIGNARGGACGDCLASVFDYAGYQAFREFYVNDAGNQINKFGLSLSLRYRQLYEDGIEMPEDSYHGEDIIQHAKNFAALHGDQYMSVSEEERQKALVAYALPLNVEKIKNDLEKYRIRYDQWFMESQLHQNGEVEKTVARLVESGYTYESEGAIWFRATDFGCDKDFVLVRANGVPTYVVPDIAYHYNKLVVRGFDKAIDVLGADHHGYVPRLKAALSALGVDVSKLDAVIVQMVRLVRDGEVIKASKRSGKAITLETLLDEIPTDAARFFFNLREPNSHFDFDLDLSVSKSNQNPVYYVQYAHARICSILEMLGRSAANAENAAAVTVDSLNAQESALIKILASFPEEIIRSAQDYDVSRMTKYAIELASAFHSFYNECRVKCENEALMQFRVCLICAVKQTIENVLAILKVDAPEKM